MRLWHYKLIPYLPKSQLLAQWRELNSIFKKQDKHILINYIYEYPKDDLFSYTLMITNEMGIRGFAIKNWNNVDHYFGNKNYKISEQPFINHHNERYLKQCFYNLQEKYDRWQNDFTDNDYCKLRMLMFDEFLEKEKE